MAQDQLVQLLAQLSEKGVKERWFLWHPLLPFWTLEPAAFGSQDKSVMLVHPLLFCADLALSSLGLGQLRGTGWPSQYCQGLGLLHQ